MASFRQDRINEQLMRELSEIIREVKDPRVGGALVSITKADCAPDLKTAKVYFSVIGSDSADTKKGLVSAHGYIRTQLARRMNLRVTPELRFIADESMEKGAKMNELMKKVEAQLAESDRINAELEAKSQSEAQAQAEE